ncbi:MAG: 1-acyl-sn-glycerol-3-phosphate acyltransferase [Myxococcales bacterium]|nr:1-acyl-sn-glycerol-3-phosphate acyltransferase [Myxococcales bacterium]
MLAYRVMRAFLRLVIRVFYRQVEVVGAEHIPQDGPVIFAGNHPNSLIDPVMIVATAGRFVHFAAKDVLFRSRLLRVFLDALGAVPIKRRQDHGADDAGGQVDNSAAFDALFEVLARGGTMGIFPEGISHDASQLSRLKTGAARIALAMAKRHPELPVRIVPCGLNFIHRRHFRSRVLVQYGPPIEIDAERIAAHDADERAAARALTDDIDQAIRALTVNAPDWSTLRVLDGVRRLYQPPRIPLAHRVELARRFATVYERVRDEPEVVGLFGRVKSYLERLTDLGISDGDLSRPPRPGAALLGGLRQLWWLFVWLPLAAPGVILHAPIGILVGWSSQRFTPRKDVIGTTKLLVGVLMVLLIYAGLITTAALTWGLAVALATAAALPLSGFATIRVLERTASLRRLLTRVVRAFSLRREMAELKSERAALEEAVLDAVERHIPDDMQPLYPERLAAR